MAPASTAFENPFVDRFMAALLLRETVLLSGFSRRILAVSFSFFLSIACSLVSLLGSVGLRSVILCHFLGLNALGFTSGPFCAFCYPLGIIKLWSGVELGQHRLLCLD